MRNGEPPSSPWLLALATTAWSLVAIEAASSAGSPIGAVIFLKYGGILLGSWWLARGLLGIRAASRARLHSRKGRRAIVVWIASLSAAAGGIAALLAWPQLLAIRVALSAPLLESYGKTSASSTLQGGRQVGLFFVLEAEVNAHQMRFTTARCNWLDDCGVLFSPGGPPESITGDSYTHLYGAWWHWHRRF